MGETMSKRLRLHLGGEADMEERAFTNPFLDYDAAGAAGLAAGAGEETGSVRPPPAADEPGLPFHPDGKVSGSRPGPRPRGAAKMVAPASPGPARVVSSLARRACRRGGVEPRAEDPGPAVSRRAASGLAGLRSARRECQAPGARRPLGAELCVRTFRWKRAGCRASIFLRPARASLCGCVRARRLAAVLGPPFVAWEQQS